MQEKSCPLQTLEGPCLGPGPIVYVHHNLEDPDLDDAAIVRVTNVFKAHFTVLAGVARKHFGITKREPHGIDDSTQELVRKLIESNARRAKGDQ